MALPIDKDAHQVERIGFRVARKEAAIIAKEADDLMVEMAEAIEVMLETGFDDQCEIAFDKYKAWKESAK